jgi:hypothetical protein
VDGLVEAVVVRRHHIVHQPIHRHKLLPQLHPQHTRRVNGPGSAADFKYVASRYVRPLPFSPTRAAVSRSAHLIERCLGVNGAQHREHVLERVEAPVLVHSGDLVQLIVDHVPVDAALFVRHPAVSCAALQQHRGAADAQLPATSSGAPWRLLHADLHNMAWSNAVHELRLNAATDVQ